MFLRSDIPLGSLHCDGDLFLCLRCDVSEASDAALFLRGRPDGNNTLGVAFNVALAASVLRLSVVVVWLGIVVWLGVVICLGVVVVWLGVVVWRKKLTGTMQRGVIFSLSIKFTSSGRSGGVLVLPGSSCKMTGPCRRCVHRHLGQRRHLLQARVHSRRAHSRRTHSLQAQPRLAFDAL